MVWDTHTQSGGGKTRDTSAIMINKKKTLRFKNSICKVEEIKKKLSDVNSLLVDVVVIL